MPLSSVVGAQSIVRPGVCTSSTKPASPYDGQVIYMTDVDQTAVWDGSSWVGIERSRDRNVIINGAMQVHQRGTSTASITTSGYYTADRFAIGLTSLGTWTQTIENDAPTGSGFRKSTKMLCTTADASPAASDYLIFYQVIERQNLQQFAKGTASAKQFTLTFWVKSSTTGNYVAEMYDNENARAVGSSYTVSAANTWEKKTITFPADTTGAFSNDNGAGISLGWWLGAGTTFTSGTLGTVWGTTTANRAVGQTNLASATNNYWQITGVQLEVGAVATPFEFEDYGTTLAKCMRYYQKSYGQSVTPGTASLNGAITVFYNSSYGAAFGFQFRSVMRATPSSLVLYSNSTGAISRVDSFGVGDTTYTLGEISDSGMRYLQFGSGTQGACFHYTASAEL